MRHRFAIIAIATGLLLLLISLVHWITAMDFERMEPSHGLQMSGRFHALTESAFLLILAGTGHLSGWSRKGFARSVGMLLLGAAGWLYYSASNTQQQQQALQDQRWAEEVRRITTGAFSVLPGKKPNPVEMSGVPWIIGLGLTGASCLIYAVTTRPKASGQRIT